MTADPGQGRATRGPSSRLHAARFLVAWVAVTAVAVALLARIELSPAGGSAEAVIVDDALRLLAFLSLPVFTFVLVALAYSVIVFRRGGVPADDPPPLPEPRGVALGWVAITSALALYVIVNPGLTGMAALGWFEDRPVDLVVRVQAEQWSWTVTYEGSGVTVRKADEIVLPVGRRVRFVVTSTDVVHALWIPAFRVKIDAVPGMETTTEATPNRLGSFEADPLYRLQCAELCGTGHARMTARVTVVEPAEFDRRIAALRAEAAR